MFIDYMNLYWFNGTWTHLYSKMFFCEWEGLEVTAGLWNCTWVSRSYHRSVCHLSSVWQWVNQELLWEGTEIQKWDKANDSSEKRGVCFRWALVVCDQLLCLQSLLSPICWRSKWYIIKSKKVINQIMPRKFKDV